MINKAHILGLILVPSLIFGNDIKQEILTLQTQLTDLGKKIDAQIKLIDEIEHEGSGMFKHISNYFSTKEEKQIFATTVHEFELYVEKSLHDGSYDHEKITADFYDSYPDHRSDFWRIKFTIIRNAVEHFVLETMLKEYTESMQRLFELQYKLNNSN
jgi:hypothetical protein